MQQRQFQRMKNKNKWLALINIPIQMGAIIYGFFYLGQYLDSKYPHESIYYYKIFVMVGVFLALYNVYRQVNDINKE